MQGYRCREPPMPQASVLQKAPSVNQQNVSRGDQEHRAGGQARPRALANGTACEEKAHDQQATLRQPKKSQAKGCSVFATVTSAWASASPSARPEHPRSQSPTLEQRQAAVQGIEGAQVAESQFGDRSICPKSVSIGIVFSLLCPRICDFWVTKNGNSKRQGFENTPRN